MSHAPAADDSHHELRRDIGMVALLFSGVGSIIGSGWLFGAFNAARQAGPGAVISWALGALMVLTIALSYAELGAMFPVSGGVVRYPHFGFGGFASYTAGWINWLAAASVAPIEVEAALQYATNYLPWLTHKVGGLPVLAPGGYMVAVALMGLFCVINFYGVKWFARFNTAIVWWKLFIIVLVAVVLMYARFVPAHFTHFGGFTPLGWHGVFSSIATGGIVFSYLGFRQGIELAGESEDPHRAVPIAVIGSVVICGIIYVALQIAFIGALPEHSLAAGWDHLSFANDFGPLAGVAETLGLGWLAALLYFDAFVSPADTGLIYTTVTARLSYAMAKNDNAPQGLAKLNKNGVPWVSLILSFVVGLIFFLPFPGWQQLVGFITSASVLSFGSGPLTTGAIRRALPRHKRPFKVPFGDVIPFLAFWSSNLIVYWTGWETNQKLFAAVGLGFVLLVIQHFLRPDEARYDWKSGSWVWPWLAGLAATSWLGSFGGGRGVLEFGTGIVALFFISLVVYAWAMAVRLPDEQVRAYLGRDLREEPEPIAEQAP
ncbi:MAG: APC family permease [Elusimicrobia bacterium]|nr:APC family permease [Elusimicrobiota bacterium]